MKLILMAFSLLSLSGCSKHIVNVSTAVDPAYTISSPALIAVIVPEHPTIKERQLGVTLKNELCKNGFTLAVTVDQANYVLGLSTENQSFQSGFSTRNTMIGSYSRANIVNNTVAYLHLFDAKNFVSGNRLAIWEGTVSAHAKVFSVYEPIMFKSAIRNIGSTVDKPYKLSRWDLKAAKKAKPCYQPAMKPITLSTE